MSAEDRIQLLQKRSSGTKHAVTEPVRSLRRRAADVTRRCAGGGGAAIDERGAQPARDRVHVEEVPRVRRLRSLPAGVGCRAAGLVHFVSFRFVSFRLVFGLIGRMQMPHADRKE
jgi:hypothetical protein